MNLWHFNIHTKENGKYMIDNKRAHIGLGNDYIDYTNRKIIVIALFIKIIIVENI